MDIELYPAPGRELAQKRSELTPDISTAFKNFNTKVFADGALARKDKELIAVAVAHATQCAYCIRAHTKLALQAGASEQQIMEAIWVAAEMRAGAAFAHSNIALDTMRRSRADGEPGG